MNPNFELVLEDCLRRMRSGVPLENCLSSYPDQAEDLRPLLSAATQVRALPIPQARPKALETNRQRMFAALEQQNWTGNIIKAPVSNPSLSRYTERIWNFLRIFLIGKENKGMKFALRLALDLVIFLAVAGAFTLNASASTLPGDPLYGVKQTWEDIRLSLTTGDQARQQLQTQLEAERRAEIQKLIQLRRPAMVEFMGTLEQMGTDTWVVSGLQFHMLPNTIVMGTPAVGQQVWVRATVQSDGQLVALEVHMDRYMNSAPGYNGTSAPVQMPSGTPWNNYSGGQHPQATPWLTSMPYDMHDDHGTWTSPTQQAPISPTQAPAPTYQNHNNYPAPTQWQQYNHNQDPTQCWDCSHDNWDNHNDMGGGGWHH
ncbi:MAG: DUF5667 domain-containing protein [Omnitrophica WOR_2 bacterium]